MERRCFSPGLSSTSHAASISKAEGKLHLWLHQISIFQDENSGQHRHSPTQWSHRARVHGRQQKQTAGAMKSMLSAQKWTEVTNANKARTTGQADVSQLPFSPPSSPRSNPSNGSSAYQLCDLGNLSESLVENLFPKPKCKQCEYFWGENDKKHWSGILPGWLMLGVSVMDGVDLLRSKHISLPCCHCQILKLAYKVQKRPYRWSWGYFK